MKKNVIANKMHCHPRLRVGISLAFLILLAACGDTVENVNQTGLEVFSSVKDLPKCTDKNKGDLALVEDDVSVRVCVNGEWVETKSGVDPEDGKDAELPNDTLEADSERVAVSLDSLAGYSQKGPFLKGSTVYLYELSDGRTLKQTNGNFTSIITRDDGRYKFTARDLASQYAMIEAQRREHQPAHAPGI